VFVSNDNMKTERWKSSENPR